MANPFEHKMSNAERMAEDLFKDAICGIQAVTGVDSIVLSAVLGRVLGESFACVDCHLEYDKALIDSEGNTPTEAMKHHILINFDFYYNEHRAKHERREHACTPKPEPKIV